MATIVLQPHGLGDHIFCQSLIKQIADLDSIVWPVLPQFIEGLKRAYPDVFWVPTGIIDRSLEGMRIDRVVNGNRVIPIRYADTINRTPYKDCMKAKYEMYGLDWNTWKDFTFERTLDHETRLFYEVLKLKDGEPFRLVNRRFTSNESKVVSIPNSKEIRNIEMSSIPGFSLFDWSMVIEKATEIHTVGTSINYIIELLELKAKEVVLYKRLPDERNYENYDYILKRQNYIYT